MDGRNGDGRSGVIMESKGMVGSGVWDIDRSVTNSTITTTLILQKLVWGCLSIENTQSY